MVTHRLRLVLVSLLVASALAEQQFEDQIAKAQQARMANPPAIQWQFPPDGYTFYNKSEIIVSFVVTNFWTPSAGKITLEINGNQAAAWDMEPNQYGETRIHVNLPEFPEGSHYVAAVLVDPNGVPLDPPVEVDCDFSVDLTNPKPVGKVDESDFCADDAGVCGSDEQCSGHGRCVRGACICDPHWTGELCDFDIFLLPRYHPEVEPRLSPSRCQKARQWNNGTKQLLANLRRINMPSQCSKDNVMLFEAPSHGLGANLHYLTVAMTRCLQGNKAMVLRAPPHMPVWLYGWHDECEVKGHGCHFLPWTNCTGDEPDVVDNYVHPRNGETFPPDSRWRPDYVQHQGTLWYRSLLIHYLLLPNMDLEAKVRYHRNALNIVHPIIGMHIRAGDACAHAATSTIRPECRPLQSYVDELHAMSQKYGVNRVFLACDDAEAAAVISSQPGLQVTMLQLDRKELFDGKWFIEYRMAHGATNTAQVAESTMIDLFLLRECDYFVGTFASQFSRLAFEMMVAYQGYVPPYASVDYPYCFNYMERMQLGVFGWNFC